MLQGDDIRRIARTARREAEAVVGVGASTDDLLYEGLRARGLQLDTARPPEIGAETFARLSRIDSKIVLNPRLASEPKLRSFVIAHEIGHHILHDASFEMRAIRYVVGDEQRFDTGYSERSLIEIQADVFAAEFLCPGDMLRREIIELRRRPSEIAARLGVEFELVLAQAVGATLLPEIGEFRMGRIEELDDVQREAVGSQAPCIFVKGAPGTGKTSVIAARAAALLDDATAPAAIAIFAHSEPAAECLRARIAGSHRDPAASMWIGTPFAFGLEVVTCHAERTGLAGDFALLDTTGAVAMLERRAAYLTKDGPGSLRAALAVIASKRRTGTASARMLKMAPTPDVVAAIEAAYAKAKLEEGRLDRADVLERAVEILRRHPSIAARYRRRFVHLLVDDLQDLPPDGLALIAILGAVGTATFATGNAMQAIRRYHGAAPDAVATFLETTRAVRFDLATDHRSKAPAVAGLAGPGLEAALRPVLTQSRARRGESDFASLCRHIRRLSASGVPLRDQAVLTRGHTRLRAVAHALASEGIAVLHLGEIAERNEVMDLVAIAALDDPSSGPRALARLGQLARYRAGSRKVKAITAAALNGGVTIMREMANAASRSGTEKPPRAGLAKLGRELAGLAGLSSTWTLVATWLFERSRYLELLTSADDANGPLKRLAVYHLLNVFREQDALGERGGARAIERLRRIGSIDQQTAFSKLSVDICDVDAVRLMTIHASQGREFEAVHLPVDARGDPIPDATPTDWSGLDEEAVRLVAFTRARQHLHLIRTDKRGDLRIDPGLLAAAAHDSRSGRHTGDLETENGMNPRPHASAAVEKQARRTIA